MKVVWSETAVAEFEVSIRHIRRDSPGRAARAAEGVLAAVDRLADGRFDGPTVVLSDGRKVMHWWVRPFHIVYARSPDALRILRVYHHARRPLWGP